MCNDGRDNDGDGLVDCDDPDCAVDGVCDEICGSGSDTDGDGLIDCDDPDCSTDSGCPEDCSNGVDDDADEALDCFDSECAFEPACSGVESICDDGQDNDSDGGSLGGGIDCQDLDCCVAAANQCAGVGVCVPEYCLPGTGDEDANGLADCDDPSCSVLPVCTGGGGAGSYQSPDGGPCAIPASGSVACSLVAGDLNSDVNSLDYVFNPYSVQGMVLEVSIDYEPVEDLVLTLQDCGGVVLSEHNGGTGSGYSQTIFDSSVLQSIEDGSAPFSGSFAPQDSLDLCVLYEVNGLWTLVVDNTAGTSTGTVSSWNITFDLGEVHCSDSMDNDGDGDVDCADPDCAGLCAP
ncbi:MAG: hypothetical protein CL928_05870 [Deltaproteobacteria bacterium]|nr:hypothetical protein [Deltaproteobacteria bacterium]